MDFSLLKDFLQELSDNIVPGHAISVYLNGEQVFKYATGFANIEEKIPMTGDEYINIYSCSKLTTVTAALQLLERGKFLVNEPISEYIPEFRDMYVKKENGDIVKAKNPITIRHLFTMTAGLTYNMQSDGMKKFCKLPENERDIVALAKNIASDPLAFEPGERFLYSMCHDVIAALVSIISGKKFRDYVKENIFEPLDIKKAVYHATPEIEHDMAEQYSFIPNAQIEELDLVEAQSSHSIKEGIIKNTGKNNHHILGAEHDSGGAGIITTVNEYSKLMAALANYGLGLTGERILSKGSVELMKTNSLNEQQIKSLNWPQLVGYGYGYGARTMIDKSVGGSIGSVGEFGWGGAAGATALIDTDYNLGVFYSHHMKNPREDYYQPRLRNVIYACLNR